MKKIVPLLVMLSILLISTYGQVVAGSELYKQHEVNYETRNFNPHTDINRKFDPSNPQQSDFSVMQWEYDFRATGVEAPKGVYVGQYLNPSVLELDYKPIWQQRNERNITYTEIQDGERLQWWTKESLGTYGVTLISTQVRFSSNEIMNGASEFWVRLPAFAHQLETIPIEFTNNWHFSYTWGGYDTDPDRMIGTTEIHSGIYLYEGGYSDFAIDGDDTAGIFDLRANSDITSIANGIVSNKRNNYNGSLYHKFNAVVNSDVTYTMAFLMISREKPYIMLDELESSYSKVTYKTIDINECYANIIGWLDGSTYHREMISLVANVSEGYSKTLDLLIEPHFSFIFTKGLGENNMFGYTTDKHDTVKINIHYPNFDFDEVIGKYPSFYIPFIMDGDYDEGINPPLNVKLGVEDGSLLPVDELSGSFASFAFGDHHYNWMSGEYDYKFNNYFLFSSPEITEPTFPIYPNELYNELIFDNISHPLTFLCRKDDRQLYNKNPNSIRYSSSSYWLGENFITGHDNSFSEFKEIVDDVSYTYWDVDYTQYGERHFYEIFTSLDFTEGRWNTIQLPAQTVVLSWSEMEMRGISNNTIVKGRHRPYIITGRNDTTANINTGDTEYSSIWNMEWSWTNIGANMLAFGTWVLNHIIDGMRTMVDSLWRGVQSLWAFIQTIPQRIYNGLVELGTWITRVVTEFFVHILEILGDLWELGGLYLNAFSYILAFMLFFLVLYAVIKIIASTEVRLFDSSSN